MSAHDLSVGGDVLDRVTRCAQRALVVYRCHPGATVRLLNVSENATYLIDDPDAGPSVLRVHRLGYHTQAEIASELAWMDALRAEAGVRTPRVLPAEDEAEIWTFILSRRLLLVAWIGSHTAVDIAQQLGAGYTAGSCDLAEAYLSRLG